MFMTLLVWVWLVKNDKWHPERATDDVYGMGLVGAGLIESIFWFAVLYLVAKGLGII